jgi:SSS family solute:Na+ symporter
MVPLTLAGIFIAARFAQTGILLTLAFDLMLCCLIPALFGGLFWKRSSIKAVFASAVTGFVLRLFFFVSVPTVYGAENTLLYVDNPFFTADFDGWCTFVAFGASLFMYVAVAALSPRTEEQREAERKELALLEKERSFTVEALYHRAVIAQREDTLDYYQRAKKAGFPVDAELEEALLAMSRPVV